MMTYKCFENILTELKKAHDIDLKIYDLGIDLSQVLEPYNNIITECLRAHYGEVGEDYITWWLYEDVEKKLYNKKGKVIKDLTEKKELWKYIERLRKAKGFVPYVPKPSMTDKERNEVLNQIKTKMF